MFFILTFFFETEELLDELVNTINNHLDMNGYLIGTTANGKRIEEILLQTKDKVIKDDCYLIEAVDINKKSKFGKSIIVDLKATLTSTYQKEYLVDMSVLIEKLSKKGIKLIHYVEYSKNENLSESENLLTQLYSEFVFKKINSVDIGDITMEIGTSPLDGSCLFHSIIQTIDATVRNNIESIIKAGLDLRENISDKIDLEDYIKLQNGSLALTQIYNLIDTYHKKIEKYAKTKNILERIDFEVESVLDILDQNDLNDKEKEIIEGLITVAFDQFKETLKDCKEWSDVSTIELVSKLLNINILVYDITNDKWVIKDLINTSYPIILIGLQNSNHFVPLYTLNNISMFGIEDYNHFF